ncbi:MAG: hypothetical protein WBD28_11600, partial [Candidatus Zixiibacteriota bacterium]
KKGEEVKIFTEPGEQVECKFKKLNQDLSDFPHQSFILDGEIVKYKGKSRLSYQDVVFHIQNKGDISEDANFRYMVFDILYLNGADIASEPLEKRKEILEKNFKDSDFVRKVKFNKLSSDSVANKLKELSTAEGTMIKGADSGYFDSSKWYKWKREFELDVLVTRVVHNKGGSHNYVCAVGSRSNPLLIGTTYSTSKKAKSGDVIRVKVDSVRKNDQGYSWYAPQVKDIRGDKKQPDPLSVLQRMIEKEDKQKKAEDLDSKEKNRFVLQVHWWNEAKHHDLRFLKNRLATGLTIFKLDIEELNQGKRFLCKWKDQCDPKWLDFEGDISPGKEDKEGNHQEELTAHIKILDSGDYETLRQELDFTSFKINGEIMNGIYLVKKVILNKSEKWLMWKKSRE